MRGGNIQIFRSKNRKNDMKNRKNKQKKRKKYEKQKYFRKEYGKTGRKKRKK